MNPVSAITRSTVLRRERARSAYLNGESMAGEWMMPAMVADSTSERLLTSLPKISRAPLGHAVDREGAALSEIHVVQVELEQLVLRQPPLERDRHEPLGDLALDARQAAALARLVEPPTSS
jgi:hypothetical protein